jgi:Fe2+ or Zn2+ uptake regulation protein
MHLVKYLFRCQGEFKALLRCEHCGAVKEVDNDDTSHYDLRQVPKEKCSTCGKDATAKGKNHD